MNPLHIFAEHSNMISGDVIIPRQAPAQFLRDARNQPFELLITLEANDKEVIRNASGSLYWDDGESFMGEDYYFLRFSFTANNYFATLTISHSHSGKVHIPTLDIIEIFGYSYFPDFSTITFSGFPLKVNQTTFCAQTNILRMQGTRMIDWSAPGIIQLMWNHSRISTTTPAATSARTSATTITILSDTQSSPETVTPTSELTIATSTQMIKTAQTLTVFTATSTESTQSLTSTKISAGTISEAETTGQTSTTTALISRTESAAPPTTVSTHAPGMQSSTTRQSSVITVSELKTTMWTTTAAMPTSQPTTTVRPMKTKEPQHTDRPTAVSFSTMTGLPTASSYETGERVSLPEMVESTSGSSEATGESQMMGGSAAPPTTTLASPKSKILVAFLFSVLSFILKVF
ncbi:hypothetical protein Tcan_17449 [Toxocara canis]|uniref:Uncharacterized protein n=1 Tax=Toxocara canis TaxID=6265 RepID=A0A0B2VMV4_TOXCA|nr:hypothetical protein Tcan_17449 [Toxocara canis]